MGWLWTTPAAPASQQANNTAQNPTSSIPTPSSQPALTRDELAERELKSFLQEIEADTHPSSTKYNRVPRSSPNSSSSTPNTSAPSNEPLSEQLLPTTMSCREAFDAAFYCNSMGGQFNNVYRYGTVRSCGENWNDFWFCMRTRGLGAAEKERAIKARYRERERARYGRMNREGGEEQGRSSEDVWTARERKVEPGEVFNHPFPDDARMSDAEWNEMQRDIRRRGVQGTLGT